MVRRRLRLLRAEIHCNDCGKVLSQDQVVMSVMCGVIHGRCLDCTLGPENALESDRVSISVDLLRRLRDGVLRRPGQ